MIKVEKVAGKRLGSWLVLGVVIRIQVGMGQAVFNGKPLARIDC